MNDVNADEFGLFFQIPPTQTIAPAHIPGMKKQKERITCLARCNGDGSEKCLYKPLENLLPHEVLMAVIHRI